MRKCLRLFGVKADRMSNELVESTLFGLVDKNPKKFFDVWVNNKSKETEFLLESAIAKGVITYGLELMLALFNIVQGVISTILTSNPVTL